MRSSSVTPLATLDLDGLTLVGASAGPEGDLWAVAVEDLGKYRKQNGGSVTRGAAHETIVLHACADGTSENIVLAPDETNFHAVQPLGDDLLLVGGRCFHTADGGEKNAVVFRNRKPLRGFCVGDGIQEVQVARDGTIWTSYFDEGVFGNYGWDQPIGASGLVSWSTSGERLSDFAPEKAGCDAICDAYALNVADDAVWVYFYTEFAVVRLPDRVHRGAPKGARAFAVDGGRLLIDGGYDHHDRWHLLTLRDMKRQAVLQFICEGKIVGGALAFGRGPFLHFVDDGRWFRIDLRSIG